MAGWFDSGSPGNIPFIEEIPWFVLVLSSSVLFCVARLLSSHFWLSFYLFHLPNHLSIADLLFPSFVGGGVQLKYDI